MLGIIKYVCSTEIAIVARSLRSLVKIKSNLGVVQCNVSTKIAENTWK